MHRSAPRRVGAWGDAIAAKRGGHFLPLILLDPPRTLGISTVGSVGGLYVIRRGTCRGRI
jgi:hypothetical protein